MKDIKVGQRWWVPAYEEVWVVESRAPDFFGYDVHVKTPAGHNVWVEASDFAKNCTRLPDITANQVYQHGDELFVTLDATRRMRNLRTGLTVRPRGDFDKHFKYLGEMPQVGQVWVGERTGSDKTIKGFTNGRVKLSFDQLGRTHYGQVPLEVFLQNHTLRTEPTFHFATGNKDAIKVEHQDRRFILREYQVEVEAFKSLREYCLADVEAEAKMRGSVGLYMSPIGEVFRVVDVAMGRVILAAEDDAEAQYVVQENHFREFYKALPLPGQLWAKGSRYVTVDRVEGGRVHYTGGSSGLRRFLNEYAKVTTFTGRSPNVQQIKKAVPEFGTSAPVPSRPFLTSNRTQEKLEQLARGYMSSMTPLMQQMIGRALRPAPEPEPCPFNKSTLGRLNTGDALGNWTKYRNTLGEKIRYANQRIKELSK